MTPLELILTPAFIIAIVGWYYTTEQLVHARSQWKHWECIAREFKDYVVHKET